MISSMRLGRVVVTPNIRAKLTQYQLTPLLARHVSGDWGDVDIDDMRSNDAAVKDGDRVMSIYTVDGHTLWIITDTDVTTILFPNEY